MADAAPDDICLSMPARAEHVRVARRVVGTLASTAGLDPVGIGDVELAVTEACTNVVRHAYREGGGRLNLKLTADPGRLEVVVTDTGVGMQAVGVNLDGAGLGLPLMASLAEEFEIRDGPGDGSEVRMAFVPTTTDTLQPA